MRLFINYIKSYLQDYPTVYKIAQKINNIIRVDQKIHKHRRKKFREQCYKKFYDGEKRIHKKYGTIEVIYDAISAKNFWHLTTGSQDEGKFSDHLFNNYILEGMVIFDIGSHTGQYTIPFAKKVGPKGHVYAFEPENDGFNAIKNNLIINNLINVNVFNLAISDHNKKINFYKRPDKDTHSIFEETSSPSEISEQVVEVVRSQTIDALFEKKIVNRIPDLIKIDTEGAEIKILRGAKKTLQSVKLLLIEIHVDDLVRQGYKNPYSTLEEELIKNNFIHHKYLDEIHILASKKQIDKK